MATHPVLAGLNQYLQEFARRVSFFSKNTFGKYSEYGKYHEKFTF